MVSEWCQDTDRSSACRSCSPGSLGSNSGHPDGPARDAWGKANTAPSSAANAVAVKAAEPLLTRQIRDRDGSYEANATTYGPSPNVGLETLVAQRIRIGCSDEARLGSAPISVTPAEVTGSPYDLLHQVCARQQPRVSAVPARIEVADVSTHLGEELPGRRIGSRGVAKDTTNVDMHERTDATLPERRTPAGRPRRQRVAAHEACWWSRLQRTRAGVPRRPPAKEGL